MDPRHRRLRTLARDPETRRVLEEIVAFEVSKREEHQDKDYDYMGWSPQEIPVPRDIFRRLKNAGAVKLSYESSNYKHYVLTDPTAVLDAISAATSDGADDDERTYTDRTLRSWRDDAAEGDLLAALANAAAPHIHGLARAKQAVLLSLASGDDRHGVRARIHTLLHGPPGTAKTELLLWASQVTNAPVFSPRITQAGLTVNLNTGDPGLLPRAHDTPWQVVLVDELEKTPQQARYHLLQALEEGEFSYGGADRVGTYDASIRFLGAANTLDEFSPEFLDRFDFQVQVPTPTASDARDILDTIADTFHGGDDDHGPAFVRDYLAWARDYNPDVPEDNLDTIKAEVRRVVDKSTDIRVPVRRGEAVLRVAYALARLRREPVNGAHAHHALTLLYPDTA